MLFKEASKDAKRLSRRMVLKGLGMGAGVVALGGLSGCTQFLSRSERGASLAPAKAPRINEREFTRQAYEVKEAWKEVLRDYHRWQATAAGDERIRQRLSAKIQQAKTLSDAVIDNWEAKGFTAELDKQIAMTNFTNIPHADRVKVAKIITQGLYEMGFSEDEIGSWSQFLLEVDFQEGKEKILAAGGTGSYVRTALLGFNPFGVDQRSETLGKFDKSPFVLKPLTSCGYVTGVCMAGVGIALTQLTIGTGTGCATCKAIGILTFAAVALICGPIHGGGCGKGKKKKK